MNTDPHWEQFRDNMAWLVYWRLEKLATARDAEAETAVLNTLPSPTIKVVPVRARRVTRKGGEQVQAVKEMA